MAKDITNIAASVRQRLLNLSREQGRVFDVVLVAYGLERLIHRLSISEHRERFILKGGMLVTLWTFDEGRFTRDADFLGFGDPSEKELTQVFSEILNIEVDDGLIFDTAELSAAPIREDQIYGGMRLRTTAYLLKTEIPITIDIGFGDAIAKPGHTIDYPSLLDLPASNILAYPPTTVIAEKFQAVVGLGLANGRMKDYYDLWAIYNAMEISETDLDAAIGATFARRETAIPTEAPEGLTAAFSQDPTKMAQWAAYTGSIDLKGLSLDEIVDAIWTYIGPSCARLSAL